MSFVVVVVVVVTFSFILFSLVQLSVSLHKFRASLRKKCPYLELFWFIFFHIWTEYRDLQSTFLYSVKIRENADQKNSKYGRFLRSASFEYFSVLDAVVLKVFSSFIRLQSFLKYFLLLLI